MTKVILFAWLLFAQLSSLALMARPTIIAHRGASGYLPEHTLESAAFAYALGADFIEQDLVMSKDGVLVVCHDIYLDTTTDVAQRFPQRARADGRFYVVDFLWDELRQLQVRERFDPRSDRAVFPGRFPHNEGSFRLCTMEEQIRLIQGLNHSTGRSVGLYPEIKAPAWHATEGKDPGVALLEMLTRYGYRTRADAVIVQCFEAPELERLRAAGSALRFVLLLESAQNTRNPPTPHLTPDGLRNVARYAQGIGPYLGLLAQRGDHGGFAFTSLAQDAREAGLFVHAYTVRQDQLPAGVSSARELLRLLADAQAIDGVFTDHPDLIPEEWKSDATSPSK